MNKKIPCILFAFNRPDKLARVVAAIRPQNVDHIVVFIDGPRDDRDVALIERCARIVEGIDWVGVDCHRKDKNEGLAGINRNMDRVFQSYDSAVFLEDDCLPMPSFYPVIRRALRHYRDDERVFSIGGYQQVPEDFFACYPYSFVSSSRFMCWGWATWKDRWEQIAPCFSGDAADLKSYKNIPDTAGSDLVSFARMTPFGRKRYWEGLSWDIRAAVLTLSLGKVHLLTTKGLIKNIGLDSGIHFSSDEANRVFYNRNVYKQRISGIRWLKDTAPDDEYNRRLKETVDTARDYFSRKAASCSFEGNPMTPAEIIANASAIINQLRERPLLTTKKIFLRILQRPIKALFNR